MNVTTIPLGGVTRHTSDAQCVDGEMAALVNLRQKGDCLVPMRAPKPIAECVSTQDFVYIHANANYKNWLAYENRTMIFVSRQVDGEENEEVATPILEVENLLDVQSVGNTLVVIYKGGIDYLLYKDGEYRLIGDFNIPLSIGFALRNITATATYSTTCDGMNISAILDNNGALTDDMKTHADGKLYEFIDKITNDGYVCQPLLVRYAYRLFDGSHIRHSSPQLVMSTNYHYTDIIACSSNSYSSDVLYTFKYIPHQLYAGIDEHSGFDASDYSDIITHIDVFVAPIPILEPEQTYKVTYKTTSTPYVDNLTYRTLDDIKEEIVNTSTFYKVASWAIDDLDSGYIDMKEVLPMLEHQDVLELDDLSHHAISAQASYVYNNKLHLANLATKLYSGHRLEALAITLPSYNGEDTGIPDDIYGVHPLGTLNGFIFTTLKTSNGTSLVVNSFSCSGIYGITPLISYPDARATNMDIYIYGDADIYEIYHFPLTASKVLNIAYYIDPQLLAIVPTYQTDTSGFPAPSLNDAKNTVEVAPNKMRVSELDNPFLFPVEQTYTISNSAIVGIASATQALSQGQFGQHPLYIFTQEGIWSMSVGNGSVTYATSLPISREVCTNGKSITPIDNAVVFASSRGIHYLSGSNIQTLTQAIDGVPKQEDWLLYDLLPCEFQIDKSIPHIRDIAANCRLGYNYVDNEIWVHADNFKFVWVYNLTQNSWSLANDSIDQFVSCYPHLYYKSGNHIYEVGNRESHNIVDTMFVTRPIKLGSLGYKKLDELYARVSATFNSIRVLLYGSNDLRNYTLIGEATNDQEYNAIQVRASHQPFRYFVVACACSIDADSAIDQLDISFRNAYNNKLR